MFQKPGEYFVQFTTYANPIKLYVDTPYWLSFNSAPEFNSLQEEVTIEAGTEKVIQVGIPVDFEQNPVFLESVELMDKRGGTTYPHWLKVENATSFSDISIVV